MTLRELLAGYVAHDEREESDRVAMLRLLDELEQPLSRSQPHAHFTASAFVVDERCARACLVQHPTLGRLLQPGGHVEPEDESLEAAALREAREETALELDLHPTAPRPFDLDIHEIPERPGEPQHFHLDVRYLLVGRGNPCRGAAWYPLGSTGELSVDRLAAKAARHAPAAALRLEPLGEAHLAGLDSILADADVLRFTRLPVPVPDGFARTWLERYQAGRADGTREGFAIVDADGAFLGLALAPHIDREAREVELGYLVSPEARGRGVATAALRLLTDWAFSSLGAFRLALLISPANTASKRVAERAGYLYDGTLRGTWFKQDLREDTEVWSRLATDP